MTNIELQPFQKEDYGLLIDWISSSELNYLWGGPGYEFPLTSEQISEHCSRPEVNPFLLLANGKAAGFIELFRVSGSHFRICRVFVADKFRGQGLSAMMIRSLTAKAKTEYGCTKLSLAVFAHNAPAIACYHSLGFETVSREQDSREFNGRPWELLRMEKAL